MSSFLNLLVPSATEVENSFYVIVIRMCQGLVEVRKQVVSHISVLNLSTLLLYKKPKLNKKPLKNKDRI